LPSATPISGDWNYSDPDLLIHLDFPVDMDQTVKPNPLNFSIDVDGNGKIPGSCDWDDARTLHIDYSEVALGPSVVRCIYGTMQPNFYSLQGQPVFPFDLLLVGV